jgi:hypothetical protein
LQALLYLHELIERGSADVDRTGGVCGRPMARMDLRALFDEIPVSYRTFSSCPVASRAQTRCGG